VKSIRNQASHDFLVPAKALSGTPGGLALEWMQKEIASGGE
jgi:hypothetical protein